MRPVQEILKREARTRKRGNQTEKFADRKIAHFPNLGCWLCIFAVCFGPFSSFGASAANSKVQEIIVVFKTHFDIGYTDLVTNVLTRYRTTFLDKALKLIEDSSTLERDRQFVWTVPGWPLRQMLWEGQTAERREKIVQALKDGRLAVHALPFTLQTESLDLEDLVRGLKFSADIARQNGLPLPRAGKMTDVPEHTWVVPTLLRHAGITFLHLGCNGGSAPMHVPMLFWWEGPDGSRLLTFYSAQYGTGILPPADWPYHTWLAMIMTGDNHGPPTAAEVDKLLKQAESELPGVRIKFGKLEDFYDALSAERNSNIPVVKGDMPDTWIHGFESMPQATKLAWNVRPLEGTVAALDTELRAAGLKPSSIKESLAAAYENSLLYSEHTFGFHGSQPGGFFYGEEWERKRAEGKYALFERSFEDKRDYIRTTARIVTNALAERLQLLVGSVAANGPRICVFNSLPWKRSGEVEIEAPGRSWVAARDLATGQTVELSHSAGALVRFFARDVPPGGYKTFALESKGQSKPPEMAASADQTVLQNKFFRLKIDANRGCIVSLKDMRTGRELVERSAEGTATVGAPAGSAARRANSQTPAGAPARTANSQTPAGAPALPVVGLGEYLHEQFSLTNVQAFMQAYCRGKGGWVDNDFGKPGMPGPDRVPYARLTLTNWTASVSEDGFAKTLTLRCAGAAPLGRAVTMTYTLYEEQPYLDIKWSIEEKTPNPLPEGGWLCLPFAVEHPRFALARLGSLIDPAKDIIEGGNRHLFCLNSGMTITGQDGYGIGLCPLDSPLVSLDEPGLWKFSLDFVPRRARVFVNLYNNEWDTNFPLWQEGSWSSRIRVWVVRGSGPETNLIEPSWEARAPLLGAYADGAGGKLPATNAGLGVSRAGTIVTYFGPDTDMDKPLLRLWELAGNGGLRTVTLPPGLKAATAVPVDLRGVRQGQALRIKNGSFKCKVSAFAPASFILDDPSGILE